MTPLFLVLGLATDDGLRAVATDGATLTDLGPALVIPGARGWTRLGLAVGGDDVRWLVAAPAGQPFGPELPPVDPACGEVRRDTVTFASEALVTVATDSSGYCGGAHPWAGTMHAARPLAALVVPSTAPRTQDVPDVLLGERAEAALGAAGLAQLPAMPPDEASCFMERAGEPAWGVVHRDGAWAVEGYIHYGYEACRGMEWPFAAPIAVPPVARPAATATIPRPAGANDWVALPGADWRVEARDGAVALVGPDGERGRLALAHPRVVQVDWASGAAAERWAVAAPAAALDPGVGDPRLRVVTRGPDDALHTWDAGPNGLAWAGSGARVGGYVVDVVRRYPRWEVERGERPPEDGLAIGRPGAVVDVFPSSLADLPDGAPGHRIAVLAVDARGVTVGVGSPASAAPEGPDPDTLPTPSVVRRVPLGPAALPGGALATAGTLVDEPPVRLSVRDAAGTAEVRCTPSGLDVVAGGRVKAHINLDGWASSWRAPDDPSPQCVIVAVEERPTPR